MKVPYIIAELSCNHCQNLNKAKKIIDLAKKSGADAVKLQTYTADSMTLNIKKKILEFQMVFGKIKNFGTFMTKQVHHMNGMLIFLNMQKKRK